MRAALLLVALCVATVYCEDWNVISSGLGLVNGIAFWNSTTGVASGPEQLLLSLDGGVSWTDVKPDETQTTRF